MEEAPAPRHEEEAAAEEAALALRFQRAFLAGLRLAELPWEDLEQMLKKARSSSPLLTVMEKTVFHPLCLKFPPSAKYRKCFLSQLIKKHESAGAEPLDQLYEALGDVLNAEEATYCYKHFFLPSGVAVTLRESVAIISRGTTGLVTWDAGFYLAEWALENSAVFSNRRILELGSGTGFTGIVICKACQPRRFTFSDHHESVLQLLPENIHLNGLSPQSEACSHEAEKDEVDPAEHSESTSITVADLDWNLVTKEQLEELRPEVVIAADVVYDPELAQSLVGVLRKFSTCSSGGQAPEVYIAFTVRNADTFHSFQMQLDQAGIGRHTVSSPQTNIFPYNRKANLTILRLIL